MPPTISLNLSAYSFEDRFPVKYSNIHRNKNGWITQAIKISCEYKRRLYIYIYTAGIVMMQ
jgi:hypothetical protein